MAADRGVAIAARRQPTTSPSHLKQQNNKMKIKTKDLQQFLIASAYMSEDKQLPAYAYTLWKGNTLSRCNEGSFCQGTSSMAASKPILLETALLQKYVADTITDFIDISEKGLKVVLSNGKTPISFISIEADLFPAMPKHKGAWADISPMLSSIGVARAFIKTQDKSGVVDNFCFVHVKSTNGVLPDGVTAGDEGANVIGNTYIFGCDNSSFYGDVFPQTGMNILISQEACKLLSSVSECQHSASDSHDFYKSGEMVFGFTKTECKTPDIHRWYDACKAPGKEHELNRNELQSFCDLAAFLKKGGIPIVEIKDGGLVLPEDEFGRGATSSLARADDLWFRFNASVMSPKLKALPAQLLRTKRNVNVLIFENSAVTPCPWVAGVVEFVMPPNL